MKRELNLTVDLKVKEHDEIRLKQMDSTRITFKILDNCKELDLQELVAEIIFTKPNRNYCYTRCYYTRR